MMIRCWLSPIFETLKGAFMQEKRLLIGLGIIVFMVLAFLIAKGIIV